ATRLAQVDSGKAAAYNQRRDDFLKRWDAALAKWQAQAAPLKGASFVSYHREWVYLATWLGMTEALTIEPKPGVPPGSAYLAQLLDDIPRRHPALVAYAAYQDARAPQFISEKSGLPLVLLPFTVGGTDKAGDLFGLFDETISRLLAGLEKSPAR